MGNSSERLSLIEEYARAVAQDDENLKQELEHWHGRYWRRLSDPNCWQGRDEGEPGSEQPFGELRRVMRIVLSARYGGVWDGKVMLTPEESLEIGLETASKILNSRG